MIATLESRSAAAVAPLSDHGLHFMSDRRTVGRLAAAHSFAREPISRKKRGAMREREEEEDHSAARRREGETPSNKGATAVASVGHNSGGQER